MNQNESKWIELDKSTSKAIKIDQQDKMNKKRGLD